MTNRDLEEKLAGALHRAAPDDLDDVLSRCAEKGKVISMTEVARKSKKARWLRPALAACLAILLLVGIGAGGFWYRDNRAVAATISLDVNPSIELTVNRAERVLTCEALNQDAADVLAEMDSGKDLVGSKLDVAVNAIVGALVRHGYLDRISSAILISVEDKDADRGARLQQELVAAVDGILQSASSQAGVLSQVVPQDSNLESQASAHHISTGKAVLVSQVLTLNSSLSFENLAQLSVEELRDLIEIGAPGMPIGQDAALSAALAQAGITAADLTYQEIDIELDDETPNYSVTIAHTGGSGEYIVDAFTGAILWSTPNGAGQPSYPAADNDIGLDAAKEIALKYTNLAAADVTWISTKQDWENGRMVYELEFVSGTTEYDITISAADGSILDYDAEPAHVPPMNTPGIETTPAPTAAPTTAPTAAPTPKPTVQPTAAPTVQPTPVQTDVGLDAARAAALNRAGLTEDQVTWIKAKQDLENSRLVYELEFISGSTEYEVTVSAADGSVLKYETEAVRTSAPPVQPSPSQNDVGLDAAKAAALSRAGLTESQVSWIKAKQDLENSKLVYELEFISGSTEYEVTVSAADGSILKYEAEAVSTSAPPVQPSPSQNDVGLDAAKAAALSRAGLTENQVTWIKAEQDRDDGRLEYELEFISGNVEYEVTVSAADGSILKYETEAVRTSAPPVQPSPSQNDVGLDAAKAAALSRAGLTENQVTWIKAEQDRDDGRLEYELEFISGNTEYEVTVSAADGSVLKYETEAVRSTTPPTPSQTDIGMAAAKAAALAKAGCTESQVIWIKTETEWDHNCLGYEIEFCHDGTAYEIWVTAADGSIYQCETEPCDHHDHHSEDHHSEDHHDEDHHGGQTGQTGDIGSDAALAAALNHAGLTQSQISRLKVERDVDDGRLEYEIEFQYNGYEYEYVIDGVTGAVLDHEIDR